MIVTPTTATREPMTLSVGPVTVGAPVELAPMAGITNSAFRTLCREFGSGLFVCEMVTTRALVERTPESLRLIQHRADERPRSIQLYGVDPVTVARAVQMLVDEDLADHIDLNFGCPVPKVTRKGGGAALPWKLDLFDAIVTAAVRAAGAIPVTIKMRKGIDDEHLTYLDAAKIARDAGVSAIALHGRTAAQHYSGVADWDSIARLRDTIPDIPILGNGDIWSASDAIEMVRRTGVDGVVVGRGCLGRPWLFADLQDAFRQYALNPNRPDSIDYEPIQPSLVQVGSAFRRHAELLGEFFQSEERACRDIRKHVAWYFKGYPVGHEIRAGLSMVRSFAEMDEWLLQLDPEAQYPGKEAEGPRGRAGAPKRTVLPEGWLDSRTLNEMQRHTVQQAELGVSGG